MSQQSHTVSVVDDDPSVCTATERLLRSAGFNVRTFTSADAFLRNLPEDGPGCVVLDLSMPGLNGLELQQRLGKSGRAWPIVFVTGYGDIATSVRAMKAGAIDFLTKPVLDDALLHAVAQALAQDSEARAELAMRCELEARVVTLTPREYEVFCLVVTGLLNKQIAARLGTTEKTIKVHRGRVMEKLEVQSLAGLVRFADALGICGPVARDAIVTTHTHVRPVFPMPHVLEQAIEHDLAIA